MAVAALVLGILAILTSFLPIINNGAFFLAALGLIFAIIGFVGIRKGKKKGKGIAIAGIVLNVVSIVIVLATQSMYGAAIDSATNGPSASVSSESQSGDDSADTNTNDLAVGTSITTEDGLDVSVQAVQTGLKNYNGDAITGITVTYTNNGSKEASFNTYDWKAEDAQGAQRSMTFYADSNNELGSGTLAAGGTVTGDVYFEGDVTKALYYASMIADKPTASWVLG